MAGIRIRVDNHGQMPKYPSKPRKVKPVTCGSARITPTPR